MKSRNAYQVYVTTLFPLFSVLQDGEVFDSFSTVILHWYSSSFLCWKQWPKRQGVHFDYVISNLQVLIKLTALCFHYGVQTIPFLFLTNSKNILWYWYRYQVESQAPRKNVSVFKTHLWQAKCTIIFKPRFELQTLVWKLQTPVWKIQTRLLKKMCTIILQTRV